jgi:hypothetical protein
MHAFRFQMTSWRYAMMLPLRGDARSLLPRLIIQRENTECRLPTGARRRSSPTTTDRAGNEASIGG